MVAFWSKNIFNPSLFKQILCEFYFLMVTKVAIPTSTVDVHAFVKSLCVDYFCPKCSKHLSIQMKKNIILWRMLNACPRHKTPKVIGKIIKLISYNMGKIPQDELLLTNVRALNFHSPKFLNTFLNHPNDIHLGAISKAMLRSTHLAFCIQSHLCESCNPIGRPLLKFN